MEGLYQIVQFWVIAEEGFVLLLLLVDKVLDVHIKAGGGDALRALGGLFTFLKQQRQEREKWVPVGTSRAHTCAHRDLLLAGLGSHQGPFPICLSLLLPRSHSFKMSPVPTVSLDGRQHVMPWHGESSLPFLGPPRASGLPHWVILAAWIFDE